METGEINIKDTFTFVKDIQDAGFSDMFMIPYDVTSLSM